MGKRLYTAPTKECYDSKCAKAPLYYGAHCVYVQRIPAGVTRDELSAFLLLRLNRAFSKEFAQQNVDPSITKITFHCCSYGHNSVSEAVVEFEDIKCSEFALNLKKTQLRNQIMEIRPFQRRLLAYHISLDATAEEIGKKIQQRLGVAFPKIFLHSPNISVSLVHTSRSRKNFQEAILEFDDVKTVDFVLRLNTVVLRGEDLLFKASFRDHDSQPDSPRNFADSPNKRQRCSTKEEIMGNPGSQPKQRDRVWNTPFDDEKETRKIGRDDWASKYRAVLAENVSLKKTLSHIQDQNTSLLIKLKNTEHAENEASSRLLELEEDLRSEVDGGTMKQLELEQELQILQKSQQEMERVAKEATTKNHELEASLSAKQQNLEQSYHVDSDLPILRSQLRDSERRFLELTRCFTEQSKAFAQERKDYRDEVNRERTRSEALERELKELRSPLVDLSAGPTVSTVKEEHD
jgi:hypothetical protein